MVPTVLGAVLGVASNFALLPGSPILSVLLFLGIAWGLMFGIQRTRNSGMGVVLLLAFTFFMRYEQIAAVDLGSNSFRLQVGRVVEDQIYPLDSLKESVRLASGLDQDKMLDGAAQQRALDALRRFGERLRGFDPATVRVVATNTLRVAKNALDFLPQGEEALGFPIEIIAGREEARLIYIGASHSLPAAVHKRLVVDIGGGSTEFIIGKGYDPLQMESLFMISWPAPMPCSTRKTGTISPIPWLIWMGPPPICNRP